VYDDPYNQVVEVNTLGSDGSNYKSVNYYPYNLMLNGEAESARNWLVNKNSIDKVLKTENFKNNVLLKSFQTSYRIFDGGDLVKPAILTVENQGNFQMSKSLYYNNYSNQGNLLEQNFGSGPKYSYIWGYNGTLPIAEIKNAGYSDVVNILGQPTIDQLNGNPSPELIRDKLSVLRNSLPNAQIKIYTYDPLVGLTGVTDEKGLSTYYDYDGLQRLKNIMDKDRNLIKHFEYHHKTQ
jgi:YD repeat-containing protein